MTLQEMLTGALNNYFKVKDNLLIAQEASVKSTLV